MKIDCTLKKNWKSKQHIGHISNITSCYSRKVYLVVFNLIFVNTKFKPESSLLPSLNTYLSLSPSLLFILPHSFMWRLTGTIQPTHLTNIFGEEKFSRLPSKNKVADEKLHFQRNTNFLVNIICLVLELLFIRYYIVC